MRVRIFKKIILLILMLAVICVKENVYAYAADNKQGVDVILMIDTSVSMGNEGRDPEKRALNIAATFVKNLPDDNLRLGVYNFSTDVNDVFAFDEIPSEEMYTAKNKIHNTLKSLEYDGEDTDMGDAFEKCANIWKTIKDEADSRKQIILFLTDGKIDFGIGANKTQEQIDAAKDSRKRMNDALNTIDFSACPVYVIAFGKEAAEGTDARSVAEREGNHFIPADDQLALLDAYDNVFENLLGTKKVEIQGKTISREEKTVALNNDDKQTELSVNITKNENGSGVVLDDDIKIVNDETNQSWTKESFEDYFDEDLGRLLKIPEEIVKSGPLSLEFDTESTDVVDIKEYYIYDISSAWLTENGMSYEKGQEITFKIKIDGIDANSFVVYAVFEKDGEEVQQIIPTHIYSGEQAQDVKVYGSSLDKDKLETFSGVKMLLDTQDNCYQTTVAFNESGEYLVHVYGENEKGFTKSEKLRFEVKKSGNSLTSWIDKIMAYISKLIEWFITLPLWGKIAVGIVGFLIIVRILFFILRVILFFFKSIVTLIFGRKSYNEYEYEDEDEDDN